MEQSAVEIWNQECWRGNRLQKCQGPGTASPPKQSRTRSTAGAWSSCALPRCGLEPVCPLLFKANSPGLLGLSREGADLSSAGAVNTAPWG